ncbi:MAG: hypothetical protein IT359_20820 [Gemmatimonadaceae bacterium]|nr:hypothetical protein [Gemmatimonadaceae bacterium]
MSTLLSLGSLVAATACGAGHRAPATNALPSATPAATRPADAAPQGAAQQGGAQQGAPQQGGAQQGAAGVLSRFAAQKLIVFPAQGVAAADPLGWRTNAGGEKVLLASLDAGLEAALGERGLANQWVFPPAMQRAARRNPTYVTDPATIRALAPVRAVLRKPEDMLSEPFASQLRSLAGVSDARYAFIPLELRIEQTPNATTGRAVLQVAVVDARGSRVVWAGEVAGEALPSYAPGVLGSLVRRVADLVVPRT